jgi:hypothetical protein
MHYKGYTGSVKYSEADHCFVGAVLGLERDSITYEGSNIDELRADFEAGVESYFESCEEIGIAPRKPAACLAALHDFIKSHNRRKILDYQGKGIWEGDLDEMRATR